MKSPAWALCFAASDFALHIPISQNSTLMCVRYPMDKQNEVFDKFKLEFFSDQWLGYFILENHIRTWYHCKFTIPLLNQVLRRI